MILLCPICRTRLPVDDEKVRAHAEVSCTLCDEHFVASESLSEDERSDSRSVAVARSDEPSKSKSSSRSTPRFVVEDDPPELDEAPLILVAHDSHQFCEEARALLEDEGYEVFVVYDGDSAQAALSRSTPRVAVLDAVLPGHLGTQLTEDLKRSKADVQVVLIASVYERFRIKQLTDPETAPDGYVDPRNVDGELLPTVRKLTGIAAGALPPRRSRKRSAAATPVDEPVFEESRPSDTGDLDELEAQLQGLLSRESSAPPPDFDDDEDREIWEKILAEEGASGLEPSESGIDIEALTDDDPEVSLASAAAVVEDDAPFQPGDLLLDDDDDDKLGLDDEEESALLSLGSFESTPATVSVDEDEEDLLLDNFPGAGESSLAISLDDDEPPPLVEPPIVEIEDVLRLDDLGMTSPPQEESSVSAELRIPVIDEDVELSAPSANAVVVDPMVTPVIEDDEDALIASLDSRLSPFDEAPQRPALDSDNPFFDTTGLPPNIRDAHEKAQRLARIIVSDIVLYNQDRIADAIRNDSFFEDLRGDIKDGREFFEEKVPPEVRRQCDYLQRMLESLVQEKRKELGL